MLSKCPGFSAPFLFTNRNVAALFIIAWVLGIRAMAACYGVASKPADEPKPLEEEDPFDAAFDKAFSAVPAPTPIVPKTDGPLDLEDLFDVAFPSAYASDVDNAGETSESEHHDEPDGDSDASSQGGHRPSPTGSANVSDVDSDWDQNVYVSRHVRKMRARGSVRRDGKLVIFNDRPIGHITSWGGNIACHCRLHARCKSPASKAWGTDAVLENWLLEGVSEDGSIKVDRDSHLQMISAVAARIRLNR